MKPILFSTPMVKAILDGKKTQTRRVIKIDDAPENWKISIAGTSIVRTEPYDVKLPRYAAGDILWVRETWQIGYKEDNPCDINTWTPLQACVPCHRSGECTLIESHPYQYLYKASPETHENYDVLTWRPSIHMPREAARLFLRVKNVRVERLQDISYDDCLQEGMHDYGTDVDTLGAFQDLWQKLNAKRGYGWDTNPWVWVYEFEKISKEEAERLEGGKGGGLRL
jgi:hypothetical protein